MDQGDAVRAFLGALDPAERDRFAGLPDLGACLAGLAGRARAAWPALELPAAPLAAYLASRLPQAPDPAAQLDAVDVDALALAWACGRGDPAAIALFDERVLAPVCGRLRRLGLSDADIGEVRQLVHVRLLAPRPGAPPRIDDYAGHGDLGGLVHVIAVRAALDLLRRRGREVAGSGDDLWRLPVAGPDPELELIKAECRSELKGAFEDAVAALSPRERNLLRLHLVDGVTLEQLARSYGVHRATIVRWLQRARASILSSLRRDLGRRLGDPGEVDALVELARSRVELSLSRVLAAR